MRVACLFVANVPLVALLRTTPELAGGCLAVASSTEGRGKVLAASPEALEKGVCLGSTVARARATCPKLALHTCPEVLQQSLWDALLDVAFACSPRAKAVAGLAQGEAAVFLDASGVGSVFRSEAGFAAAITTRAHAVELPALVSIASSQTAALIAARLQAHEPGSSIIVPPGREREFLEPLPLQLLELPPASSRKLQRRGIQHIGELARIPKQSIATRLGSEFVELARKARGEDRGAPLPAPRESRFEEADEFEYPLQFLEPLGFVLQGMITRLCARLATRGLACDALELELALEDGARDARRIALSAPTLDTKVLVRVTLLALESEPPKAAITAARIASEGLAARSDQLDFFRPAGPAPADLDRLLAELESLCGIGRVGAAEVADDYRPDRFTLKRFQPNTPRAPRSPETTSTALALRTLRPPVAAEVRVQAQQPQWIRSSVVRGPIRFSSGPWRSTGMWWSATDRFAYDIFDIQVRSGTMARLRHDLLARRWEIDALYD